MQILKGPIVGKSCYTYFDAVSYSHENTEGATKEQLYEKRLRKLAK